MNRTGGFKPLLRDMARSGVFLDAMNRTGGLKPLLRDMAPIESHSGGANLISRRDLLGQGRGAFCEVSQPIGFGGEEHQQSECHDRQHGQSDAR